MLGFPEILESSCLNKILNKNRNATKKKKKKKESVRISVKNIEALLKLS